MQRGLYWIDVRAQTRCVRNPRQGSSPLDNPVPPSSDSRDPGILMPQIVQSFRQLPISLIVNLANGLILAAVLWGAVSTPVQLSWTGLLIVVTGARFLSLRAFENASPKSEPDLAVWTTYFVAGACAAGVVWGLSGILLFHPSSFPHQVVLAFVLGGMVAGAVPLLSSVRHAYGCFAIPVVVPISIQMMRVGERIHLVMGLLLVIFGFAMLATSAQVHRLFRDAEKLRSELFSSSEVAQALEYLVRLDSLTGIPNRRLFEEELGKELANLLPQTVLYGAIAVAEQLRERILALNLPHDASPVASQVTLSFGVSSCDLASVSSPAELIRTSDIALYEAKRCGRNQIVAARKTVSVRVA